MRTARVRRGDGGTEDAEVARMDKDLSMYGFAVFGGEFTSTPELGFATSPQHREYRLGWRLGLARHAGNVSFDLGVEATRLEAANDDGGPEHRLGLRMNARW